MIVKTLGVLAGLALTIAAARLFGATPEQSGQAGGLYLLSLFSWWRLTKEKRPGD